MCDSGGASGREGDGVCSDEKGTSSSACRVTTQQSSSSSMSSASSGTPSWTHARDTLVSATPDSLTDATPAHTEALPMHPANTRHCTHVDVLGAPDTPAATPTPRV